MFLPIKKLKTMLSLLNKLDILYDEKSNTYLVKTDANLVISSTENIIMVSKGDVITIGDTINLNPPLEKINKEDRYRIKLIEEKSDG